MRFYCKVTGTFDAAHSIKGYEGKCGQLHGHTWKVTVYVEENAEIVCENGYDVDLSQLKADLREVLEEMDHRDLNYLFSKPTAENIARRVFRALYRKYNIFKVEVEETPGSGVIFTND